MMDDIVKYLPFKKAVMKIDVEGEETRAFYEAEQLLTKIDVVGILMEWVHVKKRTDERSLKLMVSNGYLPYNNHDTR